MQGFDGQGAVGSLRHAAARLLFLRQQLLGLGALVRGQLLVELLEHFYGGGSGVSENFSIIGFDDLPIAGMASPRLSTMRVDRQAIGHVAIRVLRQHLDGDMAVQQVQIGLSAVEGETVFTLPA